jgi:hypothetical protein
MLHRVCYGVAAAPTTVKQQVPGFTDHALDALGDTLPELCLANRTPGTLTIGFCRL